MTMLDKLRCSLILAGDCPECLERLDDRWRCARCGHDCWARCELKGDQERAASHALPPVGECVPHWKAGEVWVGGQWVKS